MFKLTTYCNSTTGKDYEALQISWEDSAAVLGHVVDGVEDEAALIAYLAENGAPHWITTAAEGWTDELGWGLIGPEIPLKEDE